MHGQRRDEYKARLRDETTAKKLEKKALTWNKISTELLQQKKNSSSGARMNINSQDSNTSKDIDCDSESSERSLALVLGLTDKLLSVNPDPNYLWNHRRETLLLKLKLKSDNYAAADAASEFIEQEQILTQTALQRNPKAYGAWFHRKWSIRHYLNLFLETETSRLSANTDANGDANADTDANVLIKSILRLLKAELILCGEFLMLDERNFHCWNYRRFVVGITIAVIMLEGSLGHGESENKIEGHAISSLDGCGAWDIHEWLPSLDIDLDAIGAQMAMSLSQQSQSQSLSASRNKKSIETLSQRICIEKVHSLLQSEWEFTTKKIEQNFSNGSAFHMRSKLLPILIRLDHCSVIDPDSDSAGNHHDTGIFLAAKSKWFQEELELIRNAVFTEPDDQTSWWYFRFVLSWANPMNMDDNATGDNANANDNGNNNDITHDTYAALDEYQSILYEEWDTIQELVEGEDGQCKWGLLGLYMIATTFDSIEKDEHGQREGGDEIVTCYEGQDWGALAKSYLVQLKVLDPDRSRRYDVLMED